MLEDHDLASKFITPSIYTFDYVKFWKFVNGTFILDSEIFDIRYPEYVITNCTTVQIEFSQLAGIYTRYVYYNVQLESVKGTYLYFGHRASILCA